MLRTILALLIALLPLSSSRAEGHGHIWSKPSCTAKNCVGRCCTRQCMKYCTVCMEPRSWSETNCGEGWKAGEEYNPFRPTSDLEVQIHSCSKEARWTSWEKVDTICRLDGNWYKVEERKFKCATCGHVLITDRREKKTGETCSSSAMLDAIRLVAWEGGGGKFGGGGATGGYAPQYPKKPGDCDHSKLGPRRCGPWSEFEPGCKFRNCTQTCQDCGSDRTKNPIDDEPKGCFGDFSKRRRIS